MGAPPHEKLMAQTTVMFDARRHNTSNFTNPEMNVLNLPPPEMDQLCEQLTLWFQDKLTDEAHKTLIVKLTNYCKELTGFQGLSISRVHVYDELEMLIEFDVPEDGLIGDNIKFTREEGFSRN